MNQTIPSLSRYNTHLQATVDWLQTSIKNGNGGSSAHYSRIKGWSAPYPETTGYIIPTLLDASSQLNDANLASQAIKLGEWLLDLQNVDGWWPGGLYTGNSPLNPSVFNTAQILDGLVSLYHFTKHEKWLKAADRGSIWLAKNVDAAGLWKIGNYREGVNPSYYTQVTRPMLQAWEITSNDDVKNAALRALRRILALRTDKGVFSGWGFDENKPAFTHTIAYTLRGFIESAIMLNDWQEFGEPCLTALNRLARKADFNQGKLPGAYYEDWRAVNWYSCLTGNVQVALCLLQIEQKQPDLRLVNSAAKLVDYVCSCQNITSSNHNIRGAVAGSSPLIGRYMFMRYPNWAAKYHADALIMLNARLSKEVNVHE